VPFSPPRRRHDRKLSAGKVKGKKVKVRLMEDA